MNLKRPTTMFAFFLLSVSILSGFAFQDFAYAETGMSVSVNADEGSTTISVSGHTSVRNNDITILVQAPNGNIISIDQVSPDANGDFMKDVQVGGLQWNQDGVYTIGIKQGSSTLYDFSLSVEVTGGTTAATSVSDSTLESGIGEASPIIGGTKDISGLTITDNSVLGSTTISISGHTDRTNTDVTVRVQAPNGNIVSVSQLTPGANGDFMIDVEVGGQVWSQNGMYTIAVQQGESSSYKDSVDVEIVDGAIIPEFGTIAALILAVAIISIIAVSAKTRLSIIPRY
ncbi:MAG: PEFG-CTERM sorting domain-containing protein [Thaumarchaeota archaeon]|nr:PEFG-CTERM sorting domain-containing protein [Nitrososphaerota archaeon]